MGVITVQDLKPGMITAAPVKTKAGQLIIGKNTVLTESLITRMSFYNIQSVSVIDSKDTVEEEPKKINIPYLKNKEGQILQPVFSDIMEFEKFARGKKLRLAKLPFDKLPTVLIEQAEALVINPMGFNLILNRDQLKKING